MWWRAKTSGVSTKAWEANSGETVTLGLLPRPLLRQARCSCPASFFMSLTLGLGLDSESVSLSLCLSLVYPTNRSLVCSVALGAWVGVGFQVARRGVSRGAGFVLPHRGHRLVLPGADKRRGGAVRVRSRRGATGGGTGGCSSRGTLRRPAGGIAPKAVDGGAGLVGFGCSWRRDIRGHRGVAMVLDRRCGCPTS